MRNLDYKGFVGTRLALIAVSIVATCVALWLGAIEGKDWLDSLKWFVGIYAGSEIGAKGAEAIRDKGV